MLIKIGEFLFKNIGEKIKKVATIFTTVFGLIGSILLGIGAYNLCAADYLFIDDDFAILIGIIAFLIGVLLFWLSSFLIYGFGELIELSADISYMLEIFIKEYKNSNKESLSTKSAERKES